MSGSVIQSLENLLEKTRDVLVCPEIKPKTWEEYHKQRQAIFTCLCGLNFQLGDEEKGLAAKLIAEILAEEAALRQKIQRELDDLQQRMAGVIRGRRALRGYRCSESPALLGRSV